MESIKDENMDEDEEYLRLKTEHLDAVGSSDVKEEFSAHTCCRPPTPLG